MPFQLISEFTPTGDQPEAIHQLVEGLNEGVPAQTLLGVTGSGKTFTVANVIAQVDRPTLILSHNKTLAAQLYGEFKHFFPNDKVEYFVSYYDYYQPEAYLPTSNTYIEKDLSVNEEIEKLRLSTTGALLSGRRNVIVVASVSCIYGIGNPAEFHKTIVHLDKGQKVSRNKLLLLLVEALYSRKDGEPGHGNFRVRGDVVEVYLANADEGVRIHFWGDVIERLERFDALNGRTVETPDRLTIYPANIFVTSRDTMNAAILSIQTDMVKQVDFFKEIGKHLEAKRLEERVLYDLEMMRELGYCSGIENYSRYFDQRQTGQRPFCLLDYFPEDFLMVIDESHVTVSQVRAMYGGDRSRKKNLVEYGFRLPSAMDNRPLKFEEFEGLMGQTLFVSATPADYELQRSEGVIVEQVVRPTGLLDPPIHVRSSKDQIDDLLYEIRERAAKEERVLVTTLTKRMAEELNEFLGRNGVRCKYIHSDVETLERIEILRQLRLGMFDVLVGVNLLREGLDLPEVSLVAVLDADKEGFLRSNRSLTQTAGRAARNINGMVIFYADKITDSMQRTIDETDRRRAKQEAYNTANNITPTQIKRDRSDVLRQTAVIDLHGNERGKAYVEPETLSIAADPVMQYMTVDQLERNADTLETQMRRSAKELDFIAAAQLRDELFAMRKLIEEREKASKEV
ncbi:MAG TPA: excinuclease ABC subunit UvrB [Flavobacteriales bacterium]|nr:excinuclease ABC subunit UvrB [Flavobacteriales bacterium]MBK6551525.1 excinuclease ABC subunit UvrB [Flavobacteriales bacterium]MBK7103505.1 excinuclease ABC subunit UvrB [Flavobacteriales bacterium]MBK7112435.1 excinuclease ABC subunit UvrB [Flavobacteriales bacterium]MBK7481561.1 excinuclease ABC subunit UvrB [Flavobacteriales bacterium]